MRTASFDDLARQLPADLLALAAQRGATLACVESCTGGLVAHLLTAVPGASAVFRAGFVSYHDEVKRDVLGVEATVLATHGAVSAPCAAQMALGGARLGAASLAVAITGVAGPSGGSAAKPVGTVFWAVARPGLVLGVVCATLPFDRAGNQRASALIALTLLRRALGEEPLDRPVAGIELRSAGQASEPKASPPPGPGL